MLSLIIIFIIIIFKAEARGPDNDPVEIIFEIRSKVSDKGAVIIICDHSQYGLNENTVFEGEEFKIHTIYKDSEVHHVICMNFDNHVFNSYKEESSLKNMLTFKAERKMSTQWNCTVLVHRDPPSIFPMVQYKNAHYTAAYCYVRIHVRQRESPLTILVNNMILPTVRTNLSEKYVDFTAEYHYADGDIAKVNCVDFLNPDDAMLTMRYSMAISGTINDKLPIGGTEFRLVGFIAKLDSGHNNSDMLCNKELTDRATVMVRFVMRTEFNIISVRINGMNVRPLKIVKNIYYIDYKYERFHPINVVCEVQQTNVRLVVTDDDFLAVNSYRRTELKPTKEAEMSFYLNGSSNSLLCEASNSITGAIAEKIGFYFTDGNFHRGKAEQYSLHITSSNGTGMDSYIRYGELKVIYYESNDGEILQLKCGPLLIPYNTPPYYITSLQFGDSDECSTLGCVLSKTFKVSHQNDNTRIECNVKSDSIHYYIRSLGLHQPSNKLVLSKTKVILRTRVLTTTSTTTTTTTSPVTAFTTAADPASSATSTSNTLLYCGSAAGVAVITILVVGGFWIVKKWCCCVRSSQELPSIPTPRPDPASVFYENLLSVFRPFNEREAAEMEMENIYEEIQ